MTDISSLMSSGVELMFIGMAIVFAFLALLIVMVNIMAKVIEKFFPEPDIDILTPASASTTHTDAGIIAAITAAVHQYRKNN